MNHRTGVLAGVFDHGNAVRFGDLQDVRHRDDSAVQMRHNDGSGFRGNGRIDSRGIELPGGWREIDQYGNRLHTKHILKVGFEVVSSQNDFVTGADIQASQYEFHGGGAAAAQQDLFQAVIVGQLLAQFGTVGAVVASPVTGFDQPFEHGLDEWIGARPIGRTLGTNRQTV